MRIFITGGVGMLGSALVKKLASKGHNVAIAYREHKPFFDVKGHEIDIRDSKIKDVIKAEYPDWVIHTAAVTDVDLCENNKELAKSVNVDGTKNVVDACKEAGANILFVSTTFVFDGSKRIHKEDDLRKAVNYYAQTKIDAEDIVKNSKLKKWIIVRPDQTYCWHPFQKNFVISTLSKFHKGEPFKVFDDWFNHPTFAEDLAEIIIVLLEKGETGVFNTAGSTYLNRFEWAKMIADVFKKDKNLVSPSKSAGVNLPAKRPNVHVDLSKIEKVIGRKPIGVLEGMKLMEKQKEGD
jgi:dTDP-4-dehydrorhamnose reductase